MLNIWTLKSTFDETNPQDCPRLPRNGEEGSVLALVLMFTKKEFNGPRDSTVHQRSSEFLLNSKKSPELRCFFSKLPCILYIYITSMMSHAFFWAVGELVIVLTFWLFAMLSIKLQRNFNFKCQKLSPASVIMPSNHVISLVLW